MHNVPIIPMGDAPASTPDGSGVPARPWQSSGGMSSAGASRDEGVGVALITGLAWGRSAFWLLLGSIALRG